MTVRLRIEEDIRGLKKKGFNPSATKPNVVEHGQSSKNKKTKLKSKLGPKGEFPKTSFKENASTVAMWVTNLWIADFQGITIRTMRQMWSMISLKMC